MNDISKKPKALFTLDNATALCTTLNSDPDEDWNYLVDPLGDLACIHVYDELGFSVGYF